MPVAESINYPDVLGYITGGERTNINVVQLAAALRPRVVRAGRPFEMLLLIQSACDLPLDITATLRLPDKDAKGQKDRFVSKADKLAVRLEPGGVGLVILPLSTLPDIAPSAEYKIGMDVRVVPAKNDKPGRLRTVEGGGEFYIENLPEDRQAQLNELKNLHWVTTARGNTLEANLTAMSGTVGTFADLQPSWTPLWTLRDFGDKRLLLQRFAPLIKDRILPQFTIRQVLPVMEDYTRKRFQKSTYKLKEPEVNMIARLLTLLFVYAAQDGRKITVRKTGEEFNVSRYLYDNYLADLSNPVALPNWFEALLELINKDARMAEHPVRAVAHFLYDDLLRDGMNYAFTRIEEAADIEIGSDEERRAYIMQTIASIDDGTLNFDTLYMPLVMGGIVVAGQVMQRNEAVTDLVGRLRDNLKERAPERNEDNQTTFDVTARLIDQAGRTN